MITAHFHEDTLGADDAARVPLEVAIALSEALTRGHLAGVAEINAEGQKMATVYQTRPIPHVLGVMLQGAGFVRHDAGGGMPFPRWIWWGYNDTVVL